LLPLLVGASVGCSPSIVGKDADATGSLDTEDTVDDGDEDGTATDGSTDDGEDEEEELSEEERELWAGASLAILSPSPSAFLPYGEEATFEAVLFDADGQAIDFDDISWTSDVGDWEGTGSLFDDDSLELGHHTLTATAELPDGARLASQVGGILVQDDRAGTWVGTLQVDLSFEYEGTPLNASCVGTTFLDVAPEGEGAEGESTCFLSAVIFETDLTHVFSLEFDGEEVSGEAAIDIFGFELAFPAEGDIQDRELLVSWTGELLGYADLTGTLSLEQVSRDTGDLD
jgi:hypothetical protein